MLETHKHQRQPNHQTLFDSTRSKKVRTHPFTDGPTAQDGKALAARSLTKPWTPASVPIGLLSLQSRGLSTSYYSKSLQ
jgi:hypothetical protein